MTRKGKIGWAVAAIALVGATICFWPGGKEDELRILYAGTHKENTNIVLFIITNTSNKAILAQGGSTHGDTNDPIYFNLFRNPFVGTINPNGCITNFETQPFTGQWRYVVISREDPT